MTAPRAALAGAVALLIGCLGLAVASVVPATGTILSLWVGLSSVVAAGAGFLVPRAVGRFPGAVRGALQVAAPVILFLAALLLAALLAHAGPRAWLTGLMLPAYAAGWSAAGSLWPYTGPMPTGRALPTLTAPIRGFMLGFILLFLAVGIPRARVTVAELALPLYLLTGVLTLAWLRSVGFHVAWRAEGAEVRPGVDVRRRRVLGGSLGIAALIALLVPLGIVLSLVAAGGFALSAGGGFMAHPVLDLLASTSFGIYHAAPIANPPHTDEPYRYFAGHGAHPLHPGGVDVLGLSLRFLVLLAVAYLAVAWRRHRHDGIPWRVALLQPLWTVWRLVRRLLGRFAGMALAHLPEPIAGLMPNAPSISRPWNRQALRRLPPREQILAYYGAALTEARRRRFGRWEVETPLEYEAAVSPLLETPPPALDQLTTLFDLARYSTLPLPAEAAVQARRAWLHLRRSMSTAPGRDTGAEPEESPLPHTPATGNPEP